MSLYSLSNSLHTKHLDTLISIPVWIFYPQMKPIKN